MGDSRLLKLLTGVEISTRPVNKSGREGNRASRTSRKRRAAPNTAAFLRLADMVNSPWRECSVGCRELRRWPIGVHGPPALYQQIFVIRNSSSSSLNTHHSVHLPPWPVSRRRVCLLLPNCCIWSLISPGTSGQAKNFITRTQAVRKLQISLPDFRRLCIFKGMFSVIALV